MGASPADTVLDAAAASNSRPVLTAPAEGVNVGSLVWAIACRGGSLTGGFAMQVEMQ